MGRLSREHREQVISIRVTEAEKEQLEFMMRANGYLSLSKFIRTRCLGGKSITTKPDLSPRGAIRSQVNVLSTEIGKIGNNYNSVIKEFRKLLGQKRRDGSPVVNTTTTTYFMQELYTLTLEVKSLTEKFISLVKQELDESTSS